jgi:DNA mismatch repair protein MutS
VISKAKGYLKELEADGISALPRADTADDGQISFADVGTDEIRRMLESTDLNTLTPIEAMNLLFELQKKARG